MTDAEGLAYIPCLYDDGRAEQCGAMIEDTDASRQEHRRWHAHEKNVKDRMRDAVKDRPTEKEFRAALAELRTKLREEMLEAIGDVHRDVNRIEIPAPVLPVKRSESGWSDDDEPDSVEADDWGFEDSTSPAEPTPVSDEYAASRADAAAAFTVPPTVADEDEPDPDERIAP